MSENYPKFRPIRYHDPFHPEPEPEPEPERWQPTEIEVFIISQLVPYGPDFVVRHLECSETEFETWASQTGFRRAEVDRAIRAHAKRVPPCIEAIERKARQWMGETRDSASLHQRVYDWSYLGDMLYGRSPK